MVTVFPFPAFLAVTTPLELTVAYFLLLDFQVTAFVVALAGKTLAFTVIFFPAFTVLLPADSLILLTFTLAILILMDAFFPLWSLAVAVMVTVFPAPAALVVTTPLALTVAYFVLLDFHATAGLVALEGVTLAFTVTFPPAGTVVLSADRVIPVTGTILPATSSIWMVIDASTPLPSFAFAVIVTYFPAPEAFAVTTPLLSTVAYEVLLLDQDTLLSVAFSGNTLAANFTLFPGVTLFDGILIVIPVTGISDITGTPSIVSR